MQVSIDEPSQESMTLVEFVIMVYIPTSFEIKSNTYVQMGARHIYKTAKLMKEQSIEVQEVVLPVLKQNGYFAHPENVLLSTTSDSRHNIPDLAWRGIKNGRAARKGQSSRPKVFKIPEIAVGCGIDYINMIDEKDVEVTEPPITMNVTD